MSLYSSTFLVINLGSEMIFVIAQRLQAQNIPDERAILVLEDLISGLTSNRLIKDLVKPQQTYSHSAVRDIIETIANSSSMKLDPISMNKLWELITMVLKWQLAMSANVIDISQKHLNELEAFVASEGTQLQLHRAQNVLQNFQKILNDDAKFELHKDLTEWCGSFNVRVSLLMRMGLQTNDGNFVVNNLEPIAEQMLKNIGENIYEATQNGRILENLKTTNNSSEKNSIIEQDTNVNNELKGFIDEMLGERKLSNSSIIDGNPTLLRLTSLTTSSSESKLLINNNSDDKFDNIDVHLNDNNDKLTTLFTDLNVVEDEEQNSFKDDLLNMLEEGQSEVV